VSAQPHEAYRYETDKKPGLATKLAQRRARSRTVCHSRVPLAGEITGVRSSRRSRTSYETELGDLQPRCT